MSINEIKLLVRVWINAQYNNKSPRLPYLILQREDITSLLCVNWLICLPNTKNKNSLDEDKTQPENIHNNFKNYAKQPIYQKPRYKNTNKAETPRVSAISKARKEQEDFKVSSTLFYSTQMRKTMFQKFFRKFFEVSDKSHSAKKCKKRTLRDFMNIHFVAK